MEGIVIEIVLCVIFYAVLLYFIFQPRNTQGHLRNDSNDDEGEGGLPVDFSPDFDLPPGVCLPDDPILRKIEDTEEILA
ncbi:MAG: hypothetical protein JXR10_02750 [Cyclobacteriaceae bacterium]